ncbi:response regulator [bacterium]|nr:response regulator [bacterium]
MVSNPDLSKERSEKHRRQYRLNAIEMPRVRLAGFLILCVLVTLHNRIVFGQVFWLDIGLFFGVVLSYSIISWILLYFYYKRQKKRNLGLVFLLTDIFFYTLAIYISGGDASWLFFVLSIKTADQVVTTSKRVIAFAHLTVLSYALLICYLVFIDQKEVNLSVELIKILILYVFNLYLAFTAPISERRHRKMVESVIKAKEEITNRERAEKELKGVNEQLRNSVEKEKKLALDAESANIAKSAFLATISHELRTPMNGVIGFTNMLLETPLTEDQIDYTNTIKSSGESLLALINDVLDFSKVESGELDFEELNFDPELVVFDVCNIIQPRLESKSIELLCIINDDIPAMVVGDPLRFRQILVNLLGNASKFTEEGEIEITLALEKESEKEIIIHTTIRDTGIGIPGEKLTTIFEPFQQVDGTITRKYGGTGLGLSICKKISKKMGGDVWVESPAPVMANSDSSKPEGAGSIFHFLATFRKPDQKELEIFSPASLRNKKILIVDDNETNLKLLNHLLLSVGVDLTALQDGKEVFDHLLQTHLEGKTYDLCICDIQMPDFSGYDVADQIRQSGESFACIPLVALSSTIERDSQKCLQHGFNGFLTKPIFKPKLFRMLESILGETGSLQKLKAGLSSKIHTQYSVMESLKRSARILLVEDNKVNQKLAVLMLKKAGYQVEVANDGQEAVELYQKGPNEIDLIFMDVQMPVMDGYQATEEIRRLERQLLTDNKIHSRNRSGSEINHVPIVAMTAHAMKGDRENCLKVGMDDYISKPIARKQVFDVLEKYILDGSH